MVNDLSSQWLDLRERTGSAGYVINEDILKRTYGLFIKKYVYGVETTAQITREYDREEYLLVVGEVGQPFGVGQEILSLYQEMVNAYSSFNRWFRVGVLRGEKGDFPGKPSLLAARWLCHLVGLRHRTVEIFLDLPGVEEGHTLVQVRGMDKVLAPGAFDIPCAGHVSGTDEVQESLGKELGEELNLGLDDVENLSLVARYASEMHEYLDDGLVNVEYCFLYRARLKAKAIPRIHFNDGEVAGLALVNVDELRELVRRFPERVAGGLVDSLVYY